MPKFKKKKNAKSSNKKQRFFSSKKESTQKKSTSKTKKASKKSSKKITEQSNSQNQSSPREPNTNPTNIDLENAEVDEIANLIKTATQKLKNLESQKQAKQEEVEKAIEAESEDPATFDGISGNDEETEYVHSQLEAAQKRARKLEHELETIKKEFQQEKKELEGKIKELKKELHRTAPLHEHKFFSLSKELREAVEAVENLSEDINVQKPINVDEIAARQTSPPAAAKTVTKETTSKKESDKKNQKKKGGDKKDDKKSKKKKLLITGATATILILGLTAILTMQFFSQPEVDQSLVDTYLAQSGAQPATGAVQGAATGQTADQSDSKKDYQPTTQDPAKQTIKNPQDKYTESQAEIPLDKTQWETFNDHTTGVSLEFPKNAVNIIKTDSSVTFIRKTGYIFKIQLIETGLTLDEYWAQIKGTSLNYKVSETTFADEPALHLELEDITDYPGDKYLVQKGDYIYDIWYATAGDKLAPADIERAKRMVDTFTFTE